MQLRIKFRPSTETDPLVALAQWWCATLARLMDACPPNSRRFRAVVWIAEHTSPNDY